MSFSRNPNNFLHIKPVLDAAKLAGGATLSLRSKKEAFYWRAQAYHYRKLLSANGATPYDNMIIRIAEGEVTIDFHTINTTITTPTGELITTEGPQSADPFEDEALKFRKLLDD
jgi:hypothetical protein